MNHEFFTPNSLTNSSTKYLRIDILSKDKVFLRWFLFIIRFFEKNLSDKFKKNSNVGTHTKTIVTKEC